MLTASLDAVSMCLIFLASHADNQAGQAPLLEPVSKGIKEIATETGEAQSRSMTVKKTV